MKTLGILTGIFVSISLLALWPWAFFGVIVWLGAINYARGEF